ncbi:ATP-dependent DNA helicase [Pseudoalteromonas denitrificans]|uniref:ATP-dependent DNA helicase DinG n=1 Tax=Pseudoalteromonas denitrificans DSM 6059 TaxID=1123010 RepID=A0A1I1GZN6_9GAMM|nr:ATP-dependent DNA helicase [Pseudoalteromonas denitrificans]SFC14410.1 ATP-dependent DNA helicase DinG [Pseudoalteromonas denitrificans DSM 6059]
MSQQMSKVASFFEKDGPLSFKVEGYQPRQAQIDMAIAIEKALKEKTQVVIEAGTGIGKTFAYLVPALLHEDTKSVCKIIISTGTKALQEQLFHRDLPNVLSAMKLGKKTALLKGRANYLCPFRLNQHISHVPTDDPDVLHQLAMVAKFASNTKTGDMADCIGIEEGAKVLPYVTSTSDNCLGQTCPDYDDCYIKKARMKAMEADLVIVNHHLFFADMAVKDTGFAELIPQAHGYIFDEAHQLAEIASNYFGQSVSSRALLALIKDLRLIYRSELFDMVQLGKAIDKLESSLKDFRLEFPAGSGRGDWRQILKHSGIKFAADRIINDITFLYQVIKLALERSDKIEHCFERCISFKALLELMFDTKDNSLSYWFETTRLHVSINITPLDIAQKFSDMMEKQDAAWGFTSATLSVDDSLLHFNTSLGLKPEKSLIVQSPFDYQKQALLCLPRYLPEANSQDMAHALVKVSKQLIDAAQGRCFILFTSYRMMDLVAQGISTLVKYPLLVQGQTSKRILLEKFVLHGNSVLLGTASFWEGVDVRGSTLSCVIIDKLPFIAPDDPLLQAKMKACKLAGQDPFATIQLPQAVIALKQGVGRLIRDQTDKGVLVICDNRLVTKHYGEVFISSLPNMNRTRDLDKAAEFLTQID